MRWIRQHIRSAAWLALAALVVHMAVTFGHTHAEWLSPPAAGATATAGLQAADKATGAGGPAQPHRAPRIDNFCAICASIGLLGALVLPEAQKLAPALVVVRVNEVNPADTNRAAERRSSARARAPPAA